MTDHDEALRLLREAFPESEGWIAYCEPFISSSRATVLTPCIRISYERKTCMDAARAVIAARDQLVADACRAEREHADRLAESMRSLLGEMPRIIFTDEWRNVSWRDAGECLALREMNDLLAAHDALRGVRDAS